MFGGMTVLLYLRFDHDLSPVWLNVSTVVLIVFVAWQTLNALNLCGAGVLLPVDLQKYRKLKYDRIGSIVEAVAEVMSGKSKEQVAKEAQEREKRLRYFIKHKHYYFGFPRAVLIVYCCVLYLAMLFMLAANGYIKTTVYMIVVEFFWWVGNHYTRKGIKAADEAFKLFDAPPPPTMTITDNNGGRTVVVARRVEQ